MKTTKKIIIGFVIAVIYVLLVMGIVYGVFGVYKDYKQNVEQSKTKEVTTTKEITTEKTTTKNVQAKEEKTTEETEDEGLIVIDKKAKNNEYVSLSFAGDVSFANDYLPAQHYTNGGIDAAFSKEVQKTMRDGDIFLVNNEFCYSERGTAQTAKGYCFRAKPETVKRLSEMGVDIVSIANNHAYDYGEEGFLDTIKTLDDAGMPYVGGGKDIDDATSHIVYFKINDMKIAYIAGCQIERDPPIFTKEATKDSAGVVRCFEPEVVCEMIKEAKKHSDFVVVYPHWGTEKDMSIQKDQQALAYAFIDAGADIIVGGHSHRLQGVEYYKNVPIFYSMSNFSFSSKVIDTCILNVQVDKDGIRQAKYIPCMENSGKTIQCEQVSNDYQRIISTLNKISANAAIDEEGVVSFKERDK
ncbi:MAG: CapA family protein [Lachnospiraceae bacterium]|jgi:poly-gamma-glutamate synthesis protein (capsule biosynthesis protein)|nr:CapA family protein [Lachnospiraceae bacterium]